MSSETPVARFSKTRGEEGTHFVYKPLDLPRETDEFWNDFIVEGKDRDGNPIVESGQISRSIRRLNAGLVEKELIGRRKTKVYSDDAIKTRADALWVMRSLKKNFGLPPRYAHFESDWISNIFPGQPGELNGVPCRIKSITGGSAKRKRMNYLLQEAAE